MFRHATPLLIFAMTHPQPPANPPATLGGPEAPWQLHWASPPNRPPRAPKVSADARQHAAKRGAKLRGPGGRRGCAPNRAMVYDTLWVEVS